LAGIQTLREQQHGKARPEQVIEELTWLWFCLASRKRRGKLPCLSAEPV